MFTVCVHTKKDNSKFNLIREGKRETKKNEKVATLGSQSHFGKVTHIQTTVFFYDFHKKGTKMHRYTSRQIFFTVMSKI